MNTSDIAATQQPNQMPPAEPVGTQPAAETSLANVAQAATDTDEPQLTAVLVVAEPTPEQEADIAQRLLADAAALYPGYAAPEMTLEETIAAVKATNVHIAHIAIALATDEEQAVLYYRKDHQSAQTSVPHDVVIDLIDELIDETFDPIILKLHAELTGDRYVDGLYITTPATLQSLLGQTIDIAGDTIELGPDNLRVVIDDPELVNSLIEDSLVEFDETLFGTRLSGYDLFSHFAPDAEDIAEPEAERTAATTGDTEHPSPVVEHESSEI